MKALPFPLLFLMACRACGEHKAPCDTGEPEICDGVDNNCDGFVDSEDPFLQDGTRYYQDLDQDSFGDVTDEGQLRCADPGVGYSLNSEDCDDSDGLVYPDATQRCGEDADCNGENDSLQNSTWYADRDRDGYGDPTTQTDRCGQDGELYISRAGDCDDGDANTKPSAPELCDGKDNDCDGAVDQGTDEKSVAYLDQDGDGYGLDGTTTTAECTPATPPSGYSWLPGDCDDSSARYYPGAEEKDCADPNDYNCDGAVGREDRDGDGFDACEDCDDEDPRRSPVAAEICDRIDNNCDGLKDDGDPNVDDYSRITWYRDQDGDGEGIPDEQGRACALPDDAASNSLDCDDGDASVHTGAEERGCDLVDQNCDGADWPLAVAPAGSNWVAMSESIQTLIDTAASGSLICVAPGTYTEALNLGAKELGLVAAACAAPDADTAVCPALTILDGAGSSTPLTIAGAQTSLTLVSGFTVQNGLSGQHGGGINIEDASPTLQHLWVRNNVATDGGGGIFVRGVSSTPIVVMTDVLLTQNQAEFGGGIYASGAELQLYDSNLSENIAQATGGGLYLAGRSDALATLTLDKVTIEANGLLATSSCQGGGVYALYADVQFTDVSFVAHDVPFCSGAGAFLGSVSLAWVGGLVSANTGFFGGGVVASGDLNLQDVLWEDNLASSGGALFSSGGTLSLTNMTFANNEALGSGGAITQYNGATVLVQSVDFIDNRAHDFGGAVYAGYVGASDWILSDVLFSGNEVLRDSLSGSNCDHGGGAIAIDHGTLTIEDTVFSDNQAGAASGYYGCGGAVLSAVEASVVRTTFSDNVAWSGGDGGGGAWRQGSADVSFQNVIFSGNQDGTAGGAIGGASGSDLSITNGLFVDNSADRYGGAISAHYLNITNATFVRNAVTESDAFYGGAVLANGQNTKLINVLFFQNSATTIGGALYIPSGATVDASYCDSVDNSDAYDSSGVGWYDSNNPSWSPIGSDGNQSIDPLFVNTSNPDPARWDLNLSSGSPLIDAGDPSVSDWDGTRSDVGAYGGPYGNSY